MTPRELPNPIVNAKEQAFLEALTARYENLMKPGIAKTIGGKVAEKLPDSVKELAHRAKDSIDAKITEQKLYEEAMKVVATGFQAVQEQAAKFTISEAKLVERVNEVSDCTITCLDEVCLARCYDLAALVAKTRSQSLAAAFVQGAATGAPGFVGIPFNLVFSTFLYFRAVQLVAMQYGYDVKNDAAEMELAGQVFANAMDPSAVPVGGVAAIIGKVMMTAEIEAVGRAAAKGWAEMAARGGASLLVAQLRAMANKAAQKALGKAGQQALEAGVFKTVFEQIGRRLSLKVVQRGVPLVGAALGAFFDTGQMQKIVEYADIFYAKRFILEKEARVAMLVGEVPVLPEVEADCIENAGE